MFVQPITDHKDAVLAAVDAMDAPGLAFTNVAATGACAGHAGDKPGGRLAAVVLVSDGAAVIDRKVQDKLRSAFAKRP